MTAPSNLAVGEGALWVLDSDAETVARIDLATQAVRALHGRAAAERPRRRRGSGLDRRRGAVATRRLHHRVSRVDPRSLKVTDTSQLRARSSI